MDPKDKTSTITITDPSGGYSSDYYLDDSISIGAIGANNGGTGYVTINTANNISNSVWSIGGGAGAGSVLTSNGAGVGWVNPAANITLGDEFSIENPNNGGVPFIKYKDKKLPIDQLFSMVGAFKTMLTAVAKDDEFCERHPEIRDLAYAYMLEELSK